MKDLNKSHDIAGQSNKEVQKSHKHDANLQKNSSLYFQIGLILCLLGTYGIFEMKFETKKIDQATLIPLGPEDDRYVMPTFVVEPDAPKPKPIKKLKKKVITQELKIVVDDYKITDVVDLVTSPVPTDIVDLSSFKDPVDPVDSIIEIFDMKNVEIVPIYPGCEKKKTNKDRVKCMSDKLGRLVQKKFNTDLASEHGLSGVQKIQIQFKIDQNGNITEVFTRAPHPSLEKEALRLANKIPKMKPGEQRHKPVSVIYNLPIVFKVN
ncbi:MAG: energy transducer TonB [Psychroserpens sp.]|uniref:energy transducer TonB n=1 Tax=Psychroserpens sp. TaxID=2020870 RepID=UPI0030036EBF